MLKQKKVRAGRKATIKSAQRYECYMPQARLDKANDLIADFKKLTKVKLSIAFLVREGLGLAIRKYRRDINKALAGGLHVKSRNK